MTHWRARRPDLVEHPANVSLEPSKFSLFEGFVASFVAGVVFVIAGILLLIET